MTIYEEELQNMSARLFVATMIAQGAVDRWLKEKPDSSDKRAFIEGCYQLADELIKQDRDGTKD